MGPEIDPVLDAGSSGNNEDYIWIGQEEGLDAALILDGTSGTDGDFGARKGKTGGQRYVEEFGRNVKNMLEEEPGSELEYIMAETVRNMWDHFEEDGSEAAGRYLDGEETVYPRSETVPGAVGALVRWNEEKIEILHIGDTETYVELTGEIERYGDRRHERFDEKLDEAVDKYGKMSEDAQRVRSEHRSAANMPGNYPNMSFNPVVVSKEGEHSVYPRKDVNRIVLSTDGGTARMKRLFDMDSEDVLDFIADKGVENALEELRDKEQEVDIPALKQSDDAAIADMRFKDEIGDT